MSSRLAAAAFSVLVLLAAPACAQQEMIFTTTKLIGRLLPSVVNITSFKRGEEAPDNANMVAERATERRALGSGFVLDANGTIATNYHVVQGAAGIVVTFSDGGQARAMLVAADRLADIAILHVATKHPLAPIHWAQPGSLQVGDPVIAIGNPLGVGMSVTSGIVSALNRNIMETPYDNYIQTDAPINHGNSGGPLFDMQGDVVGINTAIISPTAGSAGLGFAIPAADAMFVIDRLEKFGWIKPGWLGAKVQAVTPELASALDLADTRGAIVAAVMADSPAADAGLQQGDIILEYNKRQPVDERALLRDIGMTPEGTKVTMRVLRAGKPVDLTVTIGAYPRQLWEKEDQPIQAQEVVLKVPHDLGLHLVPLPEADRVSLHIPNGVPAVLVASVDAGTDAAWRGVGAGQAIVRVQDQRVGSPAAFEEALNRVRQEGRPFVALLVAVPKPVHPGPEWMAVRTRPG